MILTLKFCVLKGKTTTGEQFERFLRSLIRADEHSKKLKINLDLYFYCDEEGTEMVYDFVDNLRSFSLIKRNADPGDLRNSFLSTLVMERAWKDAEEGPCYFGFFDGDDEVSEDFFEEIYETVSIHEARLLILSPVALYGTEKTDVYPMKWELSLSRGRQSGMTLFDLALEDSIGGQCWGKVYHIMFLKERDIPIFGKGVFEDVRFWYSVASSLGWKDVEQCDATYFWHRDNPISLTRKCDNIPDLMQGLENLNHAKKFANEMGYPDSDKRVWKRYTMGIIDIWKRVYRSDPDPEKIPEILARIAEEVDISAFRLGKLRNDEATFLRITNEDLLNPKGTSLDELAQDLIKRSGIY